jgi:uncharacterized protein YbbK (DUF523 family)
MSEDRTSPPTLANSGPPPRILVSACLLGEAVRYHGGDARVENALLTEWQREGRLIPLCPEVAAGMPVPRPASEIIGIGGGLAVLSGAARVQRRDGSDCTAAYMRGAELAAELCERYGIGIAILKDGSPSCGSSFIYDGSFSGRRTAGVGVTAMLLRQRGVQVFSESSISEAAAALREIEAGAKRVRAPKNR